MIKNPAARAEILDIITTSQMGARRPSDISRDERKRGDLYAVFTRSDNPRGHVEIHASLSSGMVWYYGGRGVLAHEERDIAQAEQIAYLSDRLRGVPHDR